MSDNVIKRVTATILTDGGGDFTINTAEVNGEFLGLRYVVDGSNPLATGWDLTLVGLVTGISLFNGANLGISSFTSLIRAPTVDELNAASLYAAAGEPVEDRIPVSEQLVFTVAQGGAANDGVVHMFFR